MNQPQCCERRAFDYFVEQFDRLETTDGLTHAAIAISMHAFDDICPAQVVDKLQSLTDRVATRVRGSQPQALLAHLHDVLFGEDAFRGNTCDYFSPLNSYLPTVLESRRGIPITLALVYKAVAEPLGIHVEGINAPGHFLIRVQAGAEQMIVDPFAQGRILTRDDMMILFGGLSRGGGLGIDQLLRVASHRDWVARMLANLRRSLDTMRFPEDSRAMAELQAALH